MPPKKPSVIISSSWDLGLLASKLKFMGSSGREGQALVEQIRVLLHSHHPFDDLRASPMLSNGLPRNVDSPTTTRALQCFIALQFLLQLPEKSFSLLATDLAEGCLCEFWDSIIAWIQYSHSGFRSPILGRKNVDMAPLVSILTSLFRRAKVLIPDLFARTPEIYGILVDLWLHLDLYVRGDGLDTSMDELGRAYIDHAVWRSGVQDAQYWSWDDGDLNAINGARWAIRDRTRYCYRRFVFHARRFFERLRAADLKRTDPHYACLYNQLTAIRSFANHLLPVSCMPRDVIRDLVEIVRVCHSSSSALSIAENACDTLAVIWQATDDQRALVWSLRDGVLPLVLSLYHRDQPSDRVRNALGCIAILSAFAEVQRALPLDMSFVDEFPQGAGAYAQRLADIARPIYRNVCAYDQCPCSDDNPGKKLRRCPCLSARYCSRVCQSNDWHTHRALHRRARIAGVRGNLSPRSAHFLEACGEDYLRQNFESILDEVVRDLHDSRAAPPYVACVEIHIDGRTKAGWHDVSIAIADSDDKDSNAAPKEEFKGEGEVLIWAELRRIDEFAGAVPIRYMKLEKLEQEAGGTNCVGKVAPTAQT
ncbi:uncharacterized protein SCHCODRAFT_02706956 [Schizophyllum commune H4-8]|uniref:uncharacterized protein n=1 Tax=Schizophyllum commune (strain H4-8 / FGSC 9210) TaxID=578458 RepID=UPI00215E7586|nr:uncharacterized protein SCHCODRAFT_02706956 [Schizophyllum commune H4-8]KAI5884998.1 hypothetical protein SCHCODRAFT_02706956 [Schizophyllum commune H4-8]